MGHFIEFDIFKDKCLGTEDCGACIKMCPVNIFEESNGIPRTIAKNEDECILCDRCLEECINNAISISKKY